MLRFYQNIWTSKFCGYISTVGVFVTELSSMVGILFWQIVWVTTNCVGYDKLCGLRQIAVSFGDMCVCLCAYR
jgi:hypothetical protein